METPPVRPKSEDPPRGLRGVSAEQEYRPAAMAQRDADAGPPRHALEPRGPARQPTETRLVRFGSKSLSAWADA